MKPGQHPPIIVVRRSKKHAAHHGGAWKVAYADFVTAMMAFFLVMWLSAQDSRVRTAIAGYFQDPGVLPHETSNSVLNTGHGGLDPAGMPSMERRSDEVLQAERKALLTAADRIKENLTAVTEFANLRDQVEFSVTSEGLRIELIETTGSSFFDTGSSKLLGESERMLSIIAVEVGKLSNDVVVEGHTDSKPYVNSAAYGNWELSADRANAARRVMDLHGLKPGQVRAVRGFADTELRTPQQPLDQRNRRVSIVVRTQAAKELEDALRARMSGK